MKRFPLSVRGFTLVELMAAVAIIGILAAIAVPSYNAYVTRSKRAAAKTVLIDTANQLERNYTSNGCYNKTATAVCQSQAAGSSFVLGTTVAPVDSRPAYSITADFSAITGGQPGQAFVLTATPCGDLGAGCPAGAEPFTDADCGALSVTQLGERRVTVGGTTYTNATNPTLVNRCWQR